MVGDIKAIDDTISTLNNNEAAHKVMDGLQYYLSCKIKFSTDKKRAWLGQPHLINMNKKFGKLVKNVHRHRSPGMPKFLVVRPMGESKKNSADLSTCALILPMQSGNY